MGPVEGCLPCYRKGWDYVTNGSGANLQGNGYIDEVPDLFSCVNICKLVENCELVSFLKTNSRCYLKTVDARQVH